jgi:hypothetical protein
MRTKVTLVLVFLNVALFAYIFHFERTWRTEAASREARRRVLGPEAARITTLEVEAPGGTGYRLVRERETWFLTRPLERWPANPHAVTGLLQGLQLLEHETSFAVADLARNQQTPADFGLAPPRLTATFTSGDPAPAAPARQTVLRLGDSTPDGRRLYVLSPDGTRIHVVNRTLADLLSPPLAQLRDDTVFGVRVFEARSLSLQLAPRSTEAGAAGVRVRLRREGTRWTFDAPISARASRQAVELLVNDLNTLRARSFPASPAGPAPSAAPSLRLALEGNGRLEVLYLGEPVANPAPPEPGSVPGLEFLAQLEGRPTLFTTVVPPALLETLRAAQESLREKRVLDDLDPAAVTAIALSSPLQPGPGPVELRRLGEGPAARAWQLSAAAGDARTLPADAGRVQRLLEQLAALSVERFKSDAPTSADLEEWGFNRPLREIVLSRGGGIPPLVLRLGTDAARQLYARVGTAADPGNSIYQIDRAALEELPVAPHAWRDRAVTPPLAEAARITSVQLTEAEGSREVFAATLDAAGQATPAPRDPAALAGLLAALRAPAARDFLPGGFTPRVLAGGEERPWRYRLEAVITGAGGGPTPTTTTFTLLLTDRLGGSLQYAGSRELDTVFSLPQPVIDALWALTYGPRDPGPRAAPPR